MTDEVQTELKAEAKRILEDVSGLPYESDVDYSAQDRRIDGGYWAKEALDAVVAALSRPTQTADAVMALLKAGDEIADKLHVLRCDSKDEQARNCADAAGDQWSKARRAALSTFDDSGDREGVEPVAWMFIGTSGTLFWTLESGEAEEWRRLGWKETPLYAHPPTPQDSGLADELIAEMAGGGPHEWGYRDPVTGDFIADDWPFRALTALRQPRNDGELLREARDAFDYIYEVTDDDHCGVRARVEPAKINTALARLEQGEG